MRIARISGVSTLSSCQPNHRPAHLCRCQSSPNFTLRAAFTSGEVVDFINGRGTDDPPGAARTAGACSRHSPPQGQLRINAPASIAGAYVAQSAGFGPPLDSTGVTGNVFAVTPANGCAAITTPAPATGTAIALIDRGVCEFSDKVLNAQIAGYDGVILSGAASRPSYLYIHDGVAELRDASKVWGLGTRASEDRLREEVGIKDARVLCIGPAGEHLNRAAMLANDYNHFAAHSGGAVFGSKKLKAIVVSGTARPRVVDKAKLIDAGLRWRSVLQVHDVKKKKTKYGHGESWGALNNYNWRSTELDPSHIAGFDKNTLGLQPGTLTVLAARPSVGKTAFALNIGTYAATKAFNIVLAEGLWEEWREHGVNVLVCVSGAIRTPNYIASEPEQTGGLGDMTMNPEQVVQEALNALGKGPYVIPGRTNRLASFVMRHLLPRRTAIKFMGRVLRGKYVE